VPMARGEMFQPPKEVLPRRKRRQPSNAEQCLPVRHLPRGVRAEQRTAADTLQRPLLRRSRFRVQLSPSVRGAADKAAHLIG
jgi:hypothetical protein